MCTTAGGTCCTDDPQCDIDCGICPTGVGKRAIGSGTRRRRNGVSHIDVGVQTIDLPPSRIDSGVRLTDRGVSQIDSPILAIGAALSTSRSALLIIERGTSERQRSSAESFNSSPLIPRAAAAIEHVSGMMGAASRRKGNGKIAKVLLIFPNGSVLYTYRLPQTRNSPARRTRTLGDHSVTRPNTFMENRL